MRNILTFVTMFCCVAAMVFPALSLPINDRFGIPTSTDQESRILKKRSTNADINLHGSRSSRMQELIRRYMLITLLENVKGKRSWNPKKMPTKHDGTLDYERIAGIVLKKQRRRNPWYVVDMKRDIHSTEQDPEQEYVYGVDETMPGQFDNKDNTKPEDEYRIASSLMESPTSETDLSYFLMPNLDREENVQVPSNVLPQYTELAADEENGNSEDDLLKFLTA